MKVSIVIPVYNCERFLEEAILSAVHQTGYSPEVIVVNDGSTDKSLDVANRINGITVVSQPNSGVAVARNHGARIATGDFLLFLDCDDWIDPTYLAETLPLTQDPEVGVVATGMQRFGLRNDLARPTGTTLSHELYSNDLPITSLIRLTAFPGYRPMGGYEDWDLWIRILADGWRVATTDNTLFHYRVSSGSMTSTIHGREDETFARLREMNREIYQSQRV